MVGRGPLSGLHVVELATFISGPFATAMLADLGADVIKVEAHTGDPMRRFGRAKPVSPIFASLNRGKRSLVVDLKSAEGVDTLRGELRAADVFVCNWRPGAIARLGLDDADLAAENPGLVRLYVTGFGLTGPLAGEPAFDSVVQARLGHGEAQGDGTDPALATSYVVDKVSAAMATQAVLAALVARSRTGLGDRVDLAMLDAGAYLAFPDVMANRTFLDEQPASAYNTQIAAVRPLRAADGWMVLAPVTGAQVAKACEVVGCPELSRTLRQVKDPGELTIRLFSELERRLPLRTVDVWLAAFRAADIPAAPCLTLDDHLDDAQVNHNALYGVVRWPGIGPARVVRYPAVFGSWGHLRNAAPPPELGEYQRPTSKEPA